MSARDAAGAAAQHTDRTNVKIPVNAILRILSTLIRWHDAVMCSLPVECLDGWRSTEFIDIDATWPLERKLE
jgi:hypothetical protein